MTQTTVRTEVAKGMARAESNGEDLLLQVRNLDVYYSKFRAIKGVSMDVVLNNVQAKKVQTICGKSTLLMFIKQMN